MGIRPSEIGNGKEVDTPIRVTAKSETGIATIFPLVRRLSDFFVGDLKFNKPDTSDTSVRNHFFNHVQNFLELRYILLQGLSPYSKN